MQINEFESRGPERLLCPSQPGEVRPDREVTIRVSPDRRRQQIDGFGASFTDASAFLLDEVLSPSQREAAMRQLFDRQDGIGLSLLRTPMGASDYARFIYSYDDMPERQSDPELAHFSVAHDERSIIPLTLAARQFNPEIQVVATPWSAPGWMKDTGTMVTGKLLPQYYAAYAEYFVKFIEAYRAHGIEIRAVSPQNEPLFVPPNYPGMEMLAQEEIVFVRDYLRPALSRAGLAVKIIGYDHNWDRVDYAFDLLDEAAASFDGIAWHWYGGLPVSQSRVQRDYPGKEVHFFEGSGGSWIPEFQPAFSNLMRTGIEIMRNYSRSFVLWNVALDEDNGPTVPGFGESTCRGLLQVRQDTRTWEPTLDFYGLGHFSKFVRPGAFCLDSEDDAAVRNVAFANPDGSIAVVVFNDSAEGATISLDCEGVFSYRTTVAAGAAKTIVARANQEVSP